ncbi:MULTISPECIES: hypothetical protein [Streptomyces]|uniref:Lipoprotein n=1 Tax=Streptomyces dengpaensis TaxID=2049881 RepID=A0ABM6SZE1_9ACTN|nr:MULTISPECIES: hypothetical protein [Streptomyces]AVH60113.1 hypothetical protein C4B68_34850 [Streptomyces dengpaensis]PIB04659.1 hypothetical protein B1C81_32315 [Streptomyces sp. HG99]
MHRTTTTATLLVTVAVTALSGCVTVQRPPASGAPTAPARPAAPRPDGEADPQIVQAPAREALELIGPSRKPSPSARTAHRAAPPPPAAAPAAPPRRPAPRPEPRQPEPRVAVPPAAISPELPQNTDVCALGRKYGGWQPDSPEAVICEGAYGQ